MRLHKFLSHFLLLSATALLTFACGNEGEKGKAHLELNSKKQKNRAIAVISPIKGSQVTGIVTFTIKEGGVQIIADLEGLTPGQHGFHVHEHGDCGGNGMAAGGHFNPTNKQHGAPNDPNSHVGDLGNVVADEKGYAHYEHFNKMIAFSGPNNIIGRSLVIHAGEDDLKSQPTGNSGERIGCGLIEADK